MERTAHHGSVARLRPPVSARRRSTDPRPASPPGELTLVRRAAAGDTASWELLVDRHVAATWQWASTACRDPRQAEQVCAVVWLRLAESIGSLGGVPVGPWLRSAVEQEARRLRLLRRRSRAVLDPVPAVASPRPSDRTPTPREPDHDR